MQNWPEPTDGSPEAGEWTIGPCFHLLLSILGWQALTALGLHLLEVAARPLMPAAWLGRWSGPLTFVALEIVWIQVLRQYTWRSGVKPLWRDAELRSRGFWWLLGGAVAICLGANLLRMALAEGGLRLDFAGMAGGLGPVQWGPSAAVMTAAVVLAPVAEEWFFRGIIQGAVTRRWGPALSITVTSVIFGALHGLTNMWVVTVYGLVFGYLAHRRESLTLSILAHAGVNLIALAVPLGVKLAYG